MRRTCVAVALLSLAAVASGAGCATSTGTGAASVDSPTSNARATVVPPPLPSAAPGAARQGAAAPSQLRTAVPDAVVLPNGVRMAVRAVSTDAQGRLTVPDDVHQAGWWSGGARLGDQFGSMVLVGHVDAATQGIGDMAGVLRAREGDRVRVSGAGQGQTYRVVATRQLPKGELAAAVVGGARLFDQRTSSRLVLVTCSGPFDPATRHYRDNFVVVAAPVT